MTHQLPIGQENSQQASKNPLKIEVSNDFRVSRYSARTWLLEFWVKGGRSSKTGEAIPDHWGFGGYHGKLSDVARHLVERKLVFFDGTNGKDILDGISRAEYEVTTALKEAIQNGKPNPR